MCVVCKGLLLFITACHRSATATACCMCNVQVITQHKGFLFGVDETFLFCVCVVMSPAFDPRTDIQIGPAALEREISRTFAIIPI